MFWADLQGLDTVAARLNELAASDGDHWKPAGLITQLADEGKSFSDVG